MDYYNAIIRERTDAEAAKLLADDCRKKDVAINVLKQRVATLELALELATEALAAIAGRLEEVKRSSEEMQALLNVLRPVIVFANQALKGEVVE